MQTDKDNVQLANVEFKRTVPALYTSPYLVSVISKSLTVPLPLRIILRNKQYKNIVNVRVLTKGVSTHNNGQ